MPEEIVELTKEDFRYLHIYIHFIFNYIPIFIPCLLGSIAIDKVRKLRGEKVAKVSKSLILLSSMIVTFIVMAIDLLGVSDNLRNEGLSIVIGFIGGILSRSIISAITHSTFVSTMCKEFIAKNSTGLGSAFASAIGKEAEKDDENAESDQDEKETTDDKVDDKEKTKEK